jgi:energy-coupling factor transporter ATP-binding protein EcfA2
VRELGAGLSQFIIVLGNVATKRPDILLIDEPELNLHPSLQAAFLNALRGYVGHSVIFATHSLGLARSLAERIFSVTRRATGSIVRPLARTTNYVEFLGEMSFASYRELGFDTVLAVEGINDVSVTQHFLRLLGGDRKVVVFPLGGSQFINGERAHELAELKRLTDNLAVLIDSEKKSEAEPLRKDRQAFCEICKGLQLKYHVTNRRAFEHYMTDRAVKAAYGPSYEALEPFQDLESLARPWPKNENWKVAQFMTKDELMATDIGRFLESVCSAR